jgi:hypothetical protein
MTVTRGIAAATMLAGLAAGTASAAWAAPTMSGHYIFTSTNTTTGVSIPADWYFTPCGDGCASVAYTPGGPAAGQARLVNGQWTMDTPADAVRCPDGTEVAKALSSHDTWDPNTLAGTDALTYNVPACGNRAGFQQINNLQLRQAEDKGGASNRAFQK